MSRQTLLARGVGLALTLGCAPPAAPGPKAGAPSTEASAEAPAWTWPAEDEVDPAEFSRRLSGGGLASDGALLLALDGIGDRAWIASFEEGTVLEVPLPRGAEPFRAVALGGLAWMSLAGTGQVQALDLVSAEARWTAEVCRRPQGVELEAAEATVWVACAEGELVALDAADGRILRRFRVRPGARDVVARPEGLWVSQMGSVEVGLVNRAGQLLEITRAPERVLEGPQGQAGRFVPTAAWRLRGVPDGVVLLHQAALAEPLRWAPEDGGRSDLVPAEGTGPCASAVQAVTTHYRQGEPPEVGLVAEGSLVMDFVQTPGRRVVLAGAGSRTLEDRPPAMRQVDLRCAEAPLTPRDDQPLAVVEHGDLVVVLTRDPWRLEAVGAPTIFLDLGPSERLAPGAEDFFTPTGAGLACASCHPEGGADDHVWWDPERGPRRTLPFAPNLVESVPYGWGGEHPSLAGLVRAQGGESQDASSWSDQALRELLAWGSALPEPPSAVGLPPEGFSAAGCDVCHAGPRYADSRPVDVGTGGPRKTPSLLGVGSRARWLHDGCAEDLLAVFGPCGGDHAAAWSQLSADQQAELLDWLARR